MRVLVLSDIHGRKDIISKIVDSVKKSGMDLLIICGDITDFGSAEHMKDILSSFSSLKVPILFVPGNCDFPSVLGADFEHAQNIHGSCAKVDDLSFVGVGGSPLSRLHTPMEFSEDEILELLKTGFAKCSSHERLIMVSHTPPFDTKLDLTFFGEHIGSKSVRSFVQKTKPLAILCGHVHEAFGIDELDGTLISNPGPVKNGRYAIVDINKNVKVELRCLR